ncbi:hypothetical protein D9M68_928340 [compost metagenome]
MEEAEPPTMTSTLSVSIHLRAAARPTSGLFWSSTDTSSMVLPFTLPPKSSMAMRAPSTEPKPPAPE